VPALTGEHAADLVVAAFAENEGGAAGAGDVEFCGQAGRGLAAKHDFASGKNVNESGVEVPIHGDRVGFFEVGFGRGETVEERSIVGDQQKAAGILVEAADAGGGWFAILPAIREQIVNGGAFCLAVGAGVAHGFVQHDEETLGSLQGLAVDGDGGGVGLLVNPGGGDALDGDAAFADPGGGLAAGAVAERGKNLVEAAHGGRGGQVFGWLGLDSKLSWRQEWDMKAGKRSGKNAGEPDREVFAAVEAVYAELEERLVKVARDCQLSTRCCRFQLTGEVPVLTLGEAWVAARGVRASGRKELKAHPDGACPLLGREGRCTIYGQRPFGCRTHFCRAAGGVVPRKLVADLIQRLEALDEKLGGDGSRGLPEAIAAVL
jgi:hypothetical protein